MKLNNTSYCHKQIRLLCFQLEQLTGMRLMTNLSEEFNEIRFMNELSYIIIDFRRYACYTMAYDMDANEWDTVQDILTHTSWLYVGQNWQKIAEEREKKQIRKARK